MKNVFLAISLFLLLGCGEEKVKAPEGLLPPAKLTSILADIHLAESRVELMRVSPDTASLVFKRLQQEVYQKHNVSETEFNKAYDYYLNNVGALDKIYEGLIDTLGMREIKVAAQGNKNAATDSGVPAPVILNAKERKLQRIDSIRASRNPALK